MRSTLSYGCCGRLYRDLLANKMCAMADMVLSYSCHALLSAYEQSARAAGATACMRVRMWALARACSCGAVVLRLLRHASVRSCVCERACVCMRAYAARAIVYVMGCTCVGFRCG